MADNDFVNLQIPKDRVREFERLLERAAREVKGGRGIDVEDGDDSLIIKLAALQGVQVSSAVTQYGPMGIMQVKNNASETVPAFGCIRSGSNRYTSPSASDVENVFQEYDATQGDEAALKFKRRTTIAGSSNLNALFLYEYDFVVPLVTLGPGEVGPAAYSGIVPVLTKRNDSNDRHVFPYDKTHFQTTFFGPHQLMYRPDTNDDAWSLVWLHKELPNDIHYGVVTEWLDSDGNVWEDTDTNGDIWPSFATVQRKDQIGFSESGSSQYEELRVRLFNWVDYSSSPDETRHGLHSPPVALQTNVVYFRDAIPNMTGLGTYNKPDVDGVEYDAVDIGGGYTIPLITGKVDSVNGTILKVNPNPLGPLDTNMEIDVTYNPTTGDIKTSVDNEDVSRTNFGSVGSTIHFIHTGSHNGVAPWIL